MAMPEGDDRQEQIIRERFCTSVAALGPLISKLCDVPDHLLRIVLDDDLATELIECEGDEDWQFFGYAKVNISTNDKWVVIQYGTPLHLNEWAVVGNESPDDVQYRVNVHKTVVDGNVFSCIVTVEIEE